MEKVKGIILVLSCQKYKDTRLKEFVLTRTDYDGYKPIYVIGDLCMSETHKWSTLDVHTCLYIQCEDSYLHLMKKLALALHFVYERFTIKEGVLRAGDDLIFDDERLLHFINNVKYDYYGQSYFDSDYICRDQNELKKTIDDNFMVNYYETHKEDFANVQHNLSTVNVSLYTKRPRLFGAAGVLFYLSNRACHTLMQHMKHIDYNIFYFDEFTQSYPYVIEDCAVSFIMYRNNVSFTHSSFFFDNPFAIARHTNKYKDVCDGCIGKSCGMHGHH
jgi:hypothetical protein